VTPDDSASAATKAQYTAAGCRDPDARIEVVEVAGKPGAYRAVAFLRPQLPVG